jgi:hypothetical protein
MSKDSKIKLGCIVIGVAIAFMTPTGRTAVAEGPQCLATGLVVNGDTTGLDVRPCPQPNVANDNSNETLLEAVSDPPPGNFSTLYWGYEATFGNSRLNAYRAVGGNPMIGTCVPTGPDFDSNASNNGRGVAFDPMDGNLWVSRLNGLGSPGDNTIIKVVPPLTMTAACPEVKSLLVHFANGAAPQNFGFGALDIDDSKHIWAAGYPPATVGSTLRNYLYDVNRSNGLIIHSCYLPAVSMFDGNDSLTFARISGLPGSGKYLLTDNGEVSAADPLLVIDVEDCKNGNQVTAVRSFPNPGSDTGRGIAGIDFEWLGLLNTDNFNSWINPGTPPFQGSSLLGSTLTALEDIGLCGFRAKFGGTGPDFCPYQ